MSTIPARLIGVSVPDDNSQFKSGIAANDRERTPHGHDAHGNDFPHPLPPPATNTPAAPDFTDVATASVAAERSDAVPEASAEVLPETLPAERFFWALFPVPSGVHLRPDIVVPMDRAPIALTELVQDQLPVALDTVHGILVLLSGRNAQSLILACTLEKATLGRAGIVCRPLTLPAFVQTELVAMGVEAFDLTKLNVLVGAFEPIALRSQRHRRRVLMIATLAVLLAACVVGIERRSVALLKHANALQAELSRIADVIAPLPPTTDPTMDTLGPVGRLEAALHTQRLTHRGESTNITSTPMSATDAFAALLAAWPAAADETDLRTNAISVTPSSLVVTVDLAGDPRPFLGALRAPEGWRLVEPSIASVGERTHITLQFKPASRLEGGTP